MCVGGGWGGGAWPCQMSNSDGQIEFSIVKLWTFTRPFVFCEIYGYCMTFEETASTDKCFVFAEAIPPNSRILMV